MFALFPNQLNDLNVAESLSKLSTWVWFAGSAKDPTMSWIKGRILGGVIDAAMIVKCITIFT